MQTIELDELFFESVKRDRRDYIVNKIVDNVMSGVAEYKCVGEHWNLQDFVNEALGEEKVCERIADAVSSLNAVVSADSTMLVAEAARKKLKPIVEAFCNQHDVGIA